MLVAEVYHRSFASRRHLASFVGLAPSPYASGDVSRDRGINKAGTKLTRQTLVELAWFWLRYQPHSGLFPMVAGAASAARACAGVRSGSSPWRGSSPSRSGASSRTASSPPKPLKA